MVWSESVIVIARINDAYVTTAVLTQGAIVSVLDKRGNKNFQKLIKTLGGDTKKVDKRPRNITKREHIPIKGPKDHRIPRRPERDSTGAPPRSKTDLLK